MSLRTRMGLVAGVAVALAVVGVATVVYAGTRSELRGQVDRALEGRIRGFNRPPIPPGLPRGVGRLIRPFPLLPRFREHAPRESAPPFGGPVEAVELIAPSGTVVVQRPGISRIPPDGGARRIAASGSGSAFEDRHVNGVHLRVLTVGLGPAGAVEVARPLTEVDNALQRQLVLTLLVGAAGIALAALLGVAIARTALAPITRFTRRTESLTRNPDPSERLDVEGRDELARLAQSFNATLDALERSVEAQRNLVADASHELRTPIATLRANLQLLENIDQLSPEDRAGLRRDMLDELDDLTALVGDVVELARGAQPGVAVDDVRLDEVVEEAVGRARRAATDIAFVADLEPTVVRGQADRMVRAVSNLLDNARKWSPPGGTVEVGLRDGVLEVRDHGPGFDEDDLPHVFDRFYRAAAARDMPGSGLGLAIVRQAAEAHGGSVEAANAPGGGAVLRVSFGRVAPPAERADDSYVRLTAAKPAS
ncbi:MAG: HAMP domain-containing histidine kinase [Actinobacteria bacterium]|nr:HAMP domain-containing histidine kinase [Actinomycetota bacterium]